LSLLSIPIDREQLLQRGASILESGRLQDVKIQYLEDNLPSGANEVNSIPSSSRGPIQNRLSLPQLSPIRSLSEDRRHVFERLGDTINLVGNADEDGEIPVEVNPVAPPLQVAHSTAASRAASKAAGKRIATERATTTKKRAPPAPPTGVSVQRRCVTKVQNSPKRKATTGNQPAKKGTKAPTALCWNCQDTGSSPKVRRLRELHRKFSPDIMFHMETKNQDETVLKLFEKSNFTNHFTVPHVGLSGGLCLSWTDNVTIDILESSPNIIDTFVTAEGSSFYVSFV
ncbi:unnamed protein product, partial [Brassica oleracea]